MSNKEGESFMLNISTHRDARICLQRTFEDFRASGKDSFALTRSDIKENYKFLSEVCYLAVMSYRRKSPDLVPDFETYLSSHFMSVDDFKQYENDFMESV